MIKRILLAAALLLGSANTQAATTTSTGSQVTKVANGGTGNATGDLSGLYATPTYAAIQQTMTDHLSNSYNAKSMGVKCDGIELSDISTTANNATITSAAYTFTAADVGKVVEINSMTNYAVIATSTIASVSGNTATLANAADVLFSGTNLRLVMFQGSDQTTITNAINTVNAKGGGVLKLPAGVCPVTGITSQKRQVILEGDSRNSTMLYLTAGSNKAVLASENFAALTGTGLNYGPTAVFNGIQSDARVPSWFGIRKLRIDGNRFRQTSGQDACLKYYGNAQIINDVLIQNCSGEGMWTEASGGYAYSQYDWKGAEEGFMGGIIVRNVVKDGWVMRGPHDSIIEDYLTYSWAQGGTGYYGLNNQASGTTYNGSSHWWHIHAYASAANDYKNFNLAAGGDFQFVYSDFGVTNIPSGNIKINTLFMLQCGIGGASPCINITGDYNTIGQLNYTWYTGTLTPGQVMLSIPAGADGNTVNNVSGSVTVANASNITAVSNRGAFNRVEGIIANNQGTGGKCVDWGGSYGIANFRTFGCNTHLDYTSGGFHNEINFRAFRGGSEVAVNGTPNSADNWNFDGTEQRFQNVPAGSATYPGLTLGTLTNGLYGTGTTINFGIAGSNVGTFNASGLTLPGTLTANALALTTPLPVNGGGTGGADAATARTNLGLGTAATQATGFFAQVANNLSDLASATTARTNLGLGALATKTQASLTTDVSGILPVANGGTGTATPGIVAGTNVTVTGTWPNQTVNASGGGGGSGTVNSGTAGQIAYYAANGAAVSGQSTVPVTAGGTGAATAQRGFANFLSDPSSMFKWTAAVAKFRSGQTTTLTVVESGDSIMDGVSGGSRLTSQSRVTRNALTELGIPVNDNAWLGCGDDGNGGVRRDISDTRIVKGSSWGCDNTFRTIGGGTWFATTNTNALAFTPDLTVDGVKVYYVQQSGGGSFTIDNNGNAPQTVNTSGTSALGVATYTGGAGAINTYNIKWSSGGRVDIVGVVTTSSANKMLTLINAGVGGSVSAAATVTTNPWSYGSALTAIAPDMLVTNYGANDATLAVGTSTYQTNLNTIISNVNGYGGSIMMFVSPPKNPSFNGQSYAYQDTYNDVQRSTAATNSIPLLDIDNLYQTYEIAQPLGLYSDTYVHQSAGGNNIIGNGIAYVLTRQIGAGGNTLRSIMQSVETNTDYRMQNVSIINKLSAGTNFFAGNGAGAAATTATQNATIGNGAGAAITTGFNHVAMGYQALNSMQTGQNNTALGYQALKVSTGNDNTAVGTLACSTVSTGTNNVCIGRGVGSTTLTTGLRNILIGGDNTVTTPASGTNDWMNIGKLLFGNVNSATSKTLFVGGGLATPITTVTTNTTATIANQTILCDATSGAVTITLPSAASTFDSTSGAGVIFDVKKIDSSANNCVVTVTGGATNIDGATTKSWNTQYATFTFQSNGTQFWIK